MVTRTVILQWLKMRSTRNEVYEEAIRWIKVIEAKWVTRV